MKTFKIHLIRHGITQDNLDGIYSGQNESSLCEQGEQQLRQMKEEFIYPEVEFLFTSPLKRCLQTAEILYPELKPIVIDELREYDFGEFEGRDAQELHEKEPLFDDWLRGVNDVKPPFGESDEEFASRVCNSFLQIVNGIIKTSVRSAAIITHGGVISTILANFGIPEASVTDWNTPSCCGYTVQITPSLWMRGLKVEVIKEIPEVPDEAKNDDSYDSNYFMDNDDVFDIKLDD